MHQNPTLLRKILLALVVTLTGAAPFAASGQSYSVPGFTLTKQTSSASSIVFKGTATCSTISGFELSTPRRFVVDCMYPTNGSGKARTREFGLTSSLVSGIRYGSHQDKLRLVFDIGAGASKVTFGKAGGKSFLVTVTGDNTQEVKAIKKAPKPIPTKAPPKEKLVKQPTPTPTPVPVKEQPTKEPVNELPWVPSGGEFVPMPSAVAETPSPAPTQETITVAPTPANTPEIATPPTQPTQMATIVPTAAATPTATPTPTSTRTPTPTAASTPAEIVVGIPKDEIPTEIPTPPPSSSKDRDNDDSMQSELSSQGYHIIPEDSHSDRKLGNIIFDYLPPLSVPVIRLIFSSPAEYRMSKKGESEYILTIPDCMLSGVETALPYFPPEDFTGFTFVQASDDKKGSCKVRIGSERGYRISPYIKEREIQIRLTVN